MRIFPRRTPLFLYVLMDILVSGAVGYWFMLPTTSTDPALPPDMPVGRSDWISVLMMAGFWMVCYFLLDEYRDPYRKTRFKTLYRTFWQTAVGVLIFYIAGLHGSNDSGIMDILRYFILQFFWIGLFRIFFLTVSHDQIRRGRVTFNTLLIGSGPKAFELYQTIEREHKHRGYEFIGFLKVGDEVFPPLSDVLPKLGRPPDLNRIIGEYQIEETLIAVEKDHYDRLRHLMIDLFAFEGSMTIKIIPDMYDVMLGKVRIDYVYDAILIEVHREIMPRWQRAVKRLIDIGVSVLFFLLFWWLFLYVAIRVRMSSPGPVFYRQERIGLGGKPFKIIKFRSMYVGAEESGPQLSYDGDNRCTPWGAVMRKWRIDELPQFWNVLRGEMSLVGPRPERAYFIEKIMEIAPHYKHLLRVKPGITSWGQVKYGYASTVEEMIQRLEYDILYIENRSLALDIKILFYTVFVVLKGTGK